MTITQLRKKFEPHVWALVCVGGGLGGLVVHFIPSTGSSSQLPLWWQTVVCGLVAAPAAVLLLGVFTNTKYPEMCFIFAVLCGISGLPIIKKAGKLVVQREIERAGELVARLKTRPANALDVLNKLTKATARLVRISPKLEDLDVRSEADLRVKEAIETMAYVPFSDNARWHRREVFPIAYDSLTAIAAVAETANYQQAAIDARIKRASALMALRRDIPDNADGTWREVAYTKGRKDFNDDVRFYRAIGNVSLAKDAEEKLVILRQIPSHGPK